MRSNYQDGNNTIRFVLNQTSIIIKQLDIVYYERKWSGDIRWIWAAERRDEWKWKRLNNSCLVMVPVGRMRSLKRLAFNQGVQSFVFLLQLLILVATLCRSSNECRLMKYPSFGIDYRLSTAHIQRMIMHCYYNIITYFIVSS